MKLALPLLASVFLSSTLFASENLLPNGGFEEWIPQNSNMRDFMPRSFVRGETDDSDVPSQWIVSQITRLLPDGYTPEMAVFAKDETVKHSGTASIRVEKKDLETALSIGSRSDDGDWHPKPILVEPGRKYVIRGWVKADNIQVTDGTVGSLDLRLASAQNDFFSPGTERRAVSMPLPDQGGLADWTEVEVPFETKENEMALYFAISLSKGVTGTLWVDDFTLTEE